MSNLLKAPFYIVHDRLHREMFGTPGKRSGKLMSAIITELGWEEDEYWDTVKAMWEEIDEVLAKYGIQELGPID